MRRTKKYLALLLSGVILLTSQPGSAWATEGQENSTELAIEVETEIETEFESETESEEVEASEQEADTETEAEMVTEQPARTEHPMEPSDNMAVPTLPEPESEIPALGDNEPEEYESVTIEGIYYELNAGQTQQLEVYTTPVGGTVTYISSDETIAKVSSTGLVTAVSGGINGSDTAIITASIGGRSASCTIVVSNTISLSKSKYTVYTGMATTVYQLTAKPKPSEAVAVSWISANPAIATIDENGVITPKKAGKVTITATAGGVSATCEVAVKKPTLTLDSKATIYMKNPASLSGKASPTAQITWTTSDKKIATVDINGLVTPKKTGKVTISATANGITKKCTVTIKNPSITLDTARVVIFADNQWQIHADAKPATTIKWKSSNTKVVKVDKNGIITGIKAGTTKITATIPGASVSCKVVVKKNPYKLSLTKKKMMVGNSAAIYIKNLDAGTYVNYWLEEDNGSVTINNTDGICNIKAKREGKATICVTFTTVIDGENVVWGSRCVIQVTKTGISQQEFALAKGAAKALTVKRAGDASSIKKITWSSTAPKVASVKASTGKVTGKKSGTAQIKAVVTYKDGSKKTYSTKVKVSDPKWKSQAVVIGLYGQGQVSLKGTNAYSAVKWKSTKKSVATISANGTLTAHKQGKTTLKATVDGKTITCPLYVTSPKLESGDTVLKAGQKQKIVLNGTCKYSKITYQSANKNIATVSKTGVVTAKNHGSTQITIKADGVTLTYWVDCAPSAAIDARNTGYNIMYSSTYSQAYRMTTGYYDCSSLVFRAYAYNTGLLGGASAWAPTAAGMAQFMEMTGKVISYQAVDVSQLQVGDLIFYSGSDNGRYKNIYHVSIYYGGGYRLEKPLCKYYPAGNIVLIARPL